MTLCRDKEMTIEILDYHIKQLENTTELCIWDDKSFDEAMFELIKRIKRFGKRERI